jgi:uncharacterized protein (TIGR02145 family)
MKKQILLMLVLLATADMKAQIDSLIDSRDGEIYITVHIGNQVWMAENLRYKVDGSWLNPSNPNKKYGRLYDWSTIMIQNKTNKNVQGICPTGWHVPSDKEWKILERSLGMNQRESNKLNSWRGKNQGKKMKSQTGWKEIQQGAYNIGFNALPAGNYSPLGNFLGLGKDTAFWSSTQTSCLRSIVRYLEKEKAKIFRYKALKSFGATCRCVEN